MIALFYVFMQAINKFRIDLNRMILKCFKTIYCNKRSVITHNISKLIYNLTVITSSNF